MCVRDYEMLPQNHFVVAAVITLVVALVAFPGMQWVTIALWVLVSGLVAALIDLDVIVLVRVASKEDERLRPYNDISRVSKDFKGFMDTLTETGVLKRALVTHFTSSIIVTVLAYVLVPSYFYPVLIGTVSHLATDVPYIGRVFGGRKGGEVTAE